MSERLLHIAGRGPAGRGGLLLVFACCVISPAWAQEEGSATKPFTGFIKIRQKDGALSYEINVIRGKVTSGVESYEGQDAVTADIVGGWYDRERLMLMIQSRDPDIHKPWSSHVHQFKRTEEGLDLEHTLYGYGKTIESGEVYRPHVIEKIVEVE